MATVTPAFLILVIRAYGVLTHVVHAVADDRRHLRFAQRGEIARFQRKIEAVCQVMESVDERAVEVKYAEFYHDTFFLSLSF